jgi:hypothetical protein
MKRRDFMKTAAAAVTAVPAHSLEAHTLPNQPLKAQLRPHVLHPEPQADGKFILLSDGPTSPQKLVRLEVLDQAFGKGTFEALDQPDHWAMIDAGWFCGNDLYEPTEFDDAQYQIWHANYSPKCEAHDLLFDLFSDLVEGIMFYSIPDLGLEFATHPCTPRLATVKLTDINYLQTLVEAVAKRTKWIVVAP